MSDVKGIGVGSSLEYRIQVLNDVNFVRLTLHVIEISGCALGLTAFLNNQFISLNL